MPTRTAAATATATAPDSQVCAACGALVPNGRYFLNGKWVCKDCYNRMNTSGAIAAEEDRLP